MSIVQRTHSLAIGGRVQRWRKTNLYDAFNLIGFDPSQEGDEWVLICADPHVSYTQGVTEFDYRVKAECAKFAENPPDACLIIGDFLTSYVGSFGASANLSYGLAEAAYAEASLTMFSSIAPTYLILGNHDTGPEEDPLGDFCKTYLLGHFNDLHHSIEIGGVRFILLSTCHDASLNAEAVTFLDTHLATVTDEDCVIAIHQPGGNYAYDHRGMLSVIDAIPNEMTNDVYCICGHNHNFEQNGVFNAGGTVVARWQIGTAQGNWSTFDDGTNPSLAAMACRDGKVIGRFAWDGKDRMWILCPDFNLSSPVDITRPLDGIDENDILSSYVEGEYDRTGRFSAAPTLNTYRIAGTWLAYCKNVTVNFPIPPGAQRFFYITTKAPDSIDVSDDGATWQSVSVPALVTGAIIFDIPVGLQASSYLHVRIIDSVGPHISNWGFLLP